MHQTNEEVLNSRLPLSRDLAVELCALIAQVRLSRFPVHLARLACTMQCRCVCCVQMEFGDFRSPNDAASQPQSQPQQVARQGDALAAGRCPPSSRNSSRVATPTSVPHKCGEWLSHDSYSRVEFTDFVAMCCRTLEERLVERWKALSGRNASECARVYLNVCRRWPLFGRQALQRTGPSNLFTVYTNSYYAWKSVRVRLSSRSYCR